MLKFIFSIFLFTILLSCNSSHEKPLPQDEKSQYLSGFKQTFDSAFIDKHTGDSLKAYIIIPGTGCPGCISVGENLLLTFLKNKYPVRFLLTSIQSYKILRLKLGDSIINNAHVFVDRANTIIHKVDAKKQVYPMIIYNNQQDNSLVDYEYIEPDNPNALQHLYSYMHVKY